MKRFFIFATCAFFCLPIIAQNVSFCIQAHQDDWQLFNSVNIMNDLSKSKKVVFITICAGDLGQDKSGNMPVYLARELGAVYSSKFAQDVSEGGTCAALSPPQKIIISYQDEKSQIVSHPVLKYTYRNTENYFLRLPEGNINGKGFYSNHFYSLTKLQNAQIPSINAVDNSTIYNGWNDLKLTLRQIILNERGDNEKLWIYLNSMDKKYNPNDHADHFSVSSLATEAVSDLKWIGIVEWMSYHSSRRKPNLNEREHQNAVALFTAYNWAMLENGFQSHHNQHHNKWLPMEYTRIYRSPVGTFSQPEKKMDVNQPIILNRFKTGKGSDEKIIFDVNIVEKGTLNILIYNLKGVNIYNEKRNFDETGVQQIEVYTGSNGDGIDIIKVILNDRYIDAQKVL